MHASSVRIPPTDIGELQLPAILFLAVPDWRERGTVGHFVVLEKVDVDGAHLVDLSLPDGIPTGRIVLPPESLQKVWAGEALVVDTQPIGSLTQSMLAPLSTLVLTAVLLVLAAKTVCQRSAARRRLRHLIGVQPDREANP